MSIYPPTGTLEIKDATLKIAVIDLQYTSNTAKIQANSNVVTEFSRSKKLIKYPRVAMTANSSGGYVADQTNYSGYPADGYAYKLFDNSSSSYQSGSVYSSGNPTGSAQTTTASDGSTHQGVAITLDLVTRIRLSHTIITSHANYGRTPVDGTFLGSNDSSSWDVIQTFPGLSTSSDNQKHTVSITDPLRKLAYRYIRFVITKIHTSSVFNGGSLAEFRELEYFGTPEYDPEADGVDVVVKSLPNVPNTDWLEVYYDAKNYTSGTTVQDESTPQRNGTITTGVTSETVDGIKSFKFAGANNNNIISTTMSLPSGSGVGLHSVAVWFKRTVTNTTGLLFTIGDGGADTAPHIYINTSRGMVLDWWSNSLNVLNKLFLTDRWYHLVYTYSGGSHAQGTSIFIDGEPQALGPASNGGSILNLDGSDVLTIGSYPSGSYPFTGNMANFRLFNRALTQDEIYQLYAYQKEYFGHGDLSMTLKAGRLGIGTSEPRAALDVRGRILREYNPGEVIEELNSICDGSTVVVQSGSYDMADVTTGQDGTNSYATITGSTIIYTPPPGTKRVYYRFWYHWRSMGASGISHHKIQVDGNDIYGSASTIASQYYTNDHAHFPVSLEYTMNCNVGADNVNAGQFTSWTGPKTIRVVFREYNGSSYQCQLHQNGWWDGTAPPPANYLIMKPHLTIRAIA